MTNQTNSAGSQPIPFSTIFTQVKNVEWLWPGWLPLGHVTALIATPGTGKSALALWLAACATNSLPPGQPLVWPDGQPIASHTDTSAVIWCESEARWAGHKTRAEELNLPIQHLYSAVPYDQIFRIDNATDIKKLENACAKLHPRLIVLDSLAASHRQRENDAAMHGLLVQLQVIAERQKCCILIIHHLRKEDAKNPRTEVTLDDMRGSTAIGAALLSVLALDRPDKDDPGNRRLRVVKANLALEPSPLGFRWLSHTDQHGKVSSEFAFGPAPEAAGGTGRKESPTALAESTAILLTVLDASWQPASKVIELCQRRKSNLNERTIRRAMDGLINSGGAQRVYQKLNTTGAPVPVWRAAG